MYDVETIMEALALDTTFGEAFGPYAVLAFIALAATLVGVTLGVLVRDVREQLRGPVGSRRAALLRLGAPPEEEEPRPAPVG